NEAKLLLDHRCLFEVEPWFDNRVPTLENIAIFLIEKIWSKPPAAGAWKSLTLEENRFWRVQLFKDESMPELTYSYSIGALKLEATIAAPVNPDSGLIAKRRDVA